MHQRLLALLGSFALASLSLASSPQPVQVAPFQAAQPIWPVGRATEPNLQVGFTAAIDPPPAGPVVLRTAASTLYRVFLNGQFLGHGPARGPHGFYRVDEWELRPQLGPGRSLVAIEVAGYNVNSYYLLDQPAFLTAEVVADGRVLAATGSAAAPFRVSLLPQRIQKVQRYSFQRPFTEVYRLAPGWDAWRTGPISDAAAVPVEVQPTKALLPRGVPYPDFALRPPTWRVAHGQLATGLKLDKPWKDRSLTAIGPQLKGYPESELTTIPSLELQTVRNATRTAIDRPLAAGETLRLETGAFEIVDFGVNLTGFLGARLQTQAKTRLALVFDEVLSDGDVDFKRLGCVNAVVWELEPGEYTVESFEPYTLRYLKLLVLEGAATVDRLSLRELANPEVWRAHFAASDERLNRLFAAARETFRQNAVDLFMDCPSRERAGWLCDSFFTARVAHDLCGDTRLERNFFENYLLPPRFAHLPEGMLPMCYPADHDDGVFIPNWALWFVVQLEEYLDRSGDRALVAALEPRVLKLFDYFRPFRNTDGLLEKLPSWVFVEWSKANEFVQDVNYPSNMLFARALAAAGNLYHRPELTRDAERIREVIRNQGFDGEFFVDNAVRENGQLRVTKNRTEVCQYFAFFFDVATPRTHGPLWQKLAREFGPQRKQTKAFPEIHPANAFVGNVLRLELLSRYGLSQQNLDESLAYQLYMADLTGTLWENDGAYASCNHGFASHAAHVLYRDVLGLARVDASRREVTLRFSAVRLDWCAGGLPTPDGRLELRWRQDGNRRLYQAVVPAGYTLKVENPNGLELVQQP